MRHINGSVCVCVCDEHTQWTYVAVDLMDGHTGLRAQTPFKKDPSIRTQVNGDDGRLPPLTLYRRRLHRTG